MTATVLNIEVRSPDDDARLSQTIDAFIEADSLSSSRETGEPPLMVRSGFGPTGEKHKSLIFISSEAADAFLALWLSRAAVA